MYVRMYWGKIKRGMWDEYERYYNEKVAPGSKNMKGFKGRQLLQSTDNPDEGISITMWETREDSERYAKSATRNTLAKEVERLYSGEYWVKQFEVRSSTP